MTSYLFAFALCGFHVGITLLALYRARAALLRAAAEGRADRSTMWRLSMLRLIGVLAAVSGGMLGLITPLIILAEMYPGVLTGYTQAFAIVSVAAWLVWIPSTIGLDNFARRWLR